MSRVGGHEKGWPLRGLNWNYGATTGARAPAYKNVAAAERLERQSPATVSTGAGYSNCGIALNEIDILVFIVSPGCTDLHLAPAQTR